jgi:hypothetical protein
MTYATAMAVTAVTVFLGAILITALGRERRGIQFGVTAAGEETTVAELLPE